MAKAVRNNQVIENTINKLQKNVTVDNITYLHELNEKILYSKK